MFEKNSIIGRIAKGEFPDHVVKTGYGEFKVKFPSGKDFGVIARRKASIFGGLPIDSFDSNFIRVAHRDATLSVVITSYPEKVPEEWRKENIDDFPDEEVKNSILKEFNTFFSGTQAGISKESK